MDMCCKHSHVIPAEDYVRYRLAVNRAIAEWQRSGWLEKRVKFWQLPWFKNTIDR